MRVPDRKNTYNTMLSSVWTFLESSPKCETVWILTGFVGDWMNLARITDWHVRCFSTFGNATFERI